MNLLKKPLFSLHCFGMVFTPSLIPSIIFIILLYILINLGVWQWHRGEFKKQLELSYQTNNKSATQAFNPLKTLPEYSKVKLIGTYDGKHSFLLDNAILNHRVGFEVFTPFTPTNSTCTILINRGWIPRTQAYTKLPPVLPIHGIQHIEGFTRSFPTKTFVLAKTIPSATWPQLIESLNRAEISKLLAKQIPPTFILLSPSAVGGFERRWTPHSGISPQRHFAYAIQWFALALTLVIIYAFLTIHRETHGPD